MTWRRHVAWLPLILLAAGCPQRSELRVEGEWTRYSSNESEPLLSVALHSDGSYETTASSLGRSETHSGRYNTGDSKSFDIVFPVVSTTKPGSSRMHLEYDSSTDTLTDRGSAIFVKSDRNAPARVTERVDVDLGDWKQVWEAHPEGNTADLGMAVSPIGADGHYQIAATNNDSVTLLDDAGKQLYKVSVPAIQGGRVAWGQVMGQPYLVCYGAWTHAVQAVDMRGKPMWTIAPGDGVLSVAPVRIDPKNTGMIIGYNGFGGVQVVNERGETVRKYAEPGNVWSVCHVHMKKGLPDAAFMVNHSASVFTLQGKKLVDIDPGSVAAAVYGADLDGDGLDELLTISSVGTSSKLTAFTREAKPIWSKAISIPQGESGLKMFSITLGGKDMIAVSTKQSIAFFSRTGELQSQLSVPSLAVCALSTGGKNDRLLIRTRDALRCYELPR